MPARDVLGALLSGLEISVTAIIFAFVGFKLGENLGDLWRMIGVIAGAFGGYCFAVRNVLKTAPQTSTPPSDEEGQA